MVSIIMTNSLGRVLPSIVSNFQDAFVPGQNIHNHILLAYELFKGYCMKGGVRRVMMQIDLQKAYDMVNWRNMENILQEVCLTRIFIEWIMACVTSVSYKFNVNGNLTNFMQAKRGIRQGDPMSHLLFVIIMEYMHNNS